MTTAAIEIADLRKSYRNGLLRRSFPALCGVTFRVERGEIFGLLGPNGAGKTTLIKVLLGIVRRSGGDALLLGRPAGNVESRLKVGYLPENLRIAGHHTAITALEYYGQLSGLTRSEVRQRSGALLESVGLAGRVRESVKKYSKGMLQRLGMAQALLHKPELLILDEPTDGLDPVGRSHVRALLSNLRAEGVTVFLNSHILQEVELICDRVAILDRGVLRALGRADQIAPQQAEGIEVELIVSGAESAIRAGLGQRGVNHWERQESGIHRLRIRLLDQQAVDALVDDLRRAGVSVIGLSRRRVTLEDAFLSLFAERVLS
jgi:ABC-2 type transport system ATP-binding protein